MFLVGLPSWAASMLGLPPVFLDLVSELEGQGVGRKVIADMFGLALRSYQQKVQRLQGSAAERDPTLWEAMLRFIQEHSAPEPGWEAALLEHFQAVVGAVCGKLAVLSGSKAAPARLGGSTFTIDVWPGHPHYEQVVRLLGAASTISPLWGMPFGRTTHSCPNP